MSEYPKQFARGEDVRTANDATEEVQLRHRGFKLVVAKKAPVAKAAEKS